MAINHSYSGVSQTAESVSAVAGNLRTMLEELQGQVRAKVENWDSETRNVFEFQMRRWDAAMANLGMTEDAAARTFVNSSAMYRATDSHGARLLRDGL
ncbi:WXG100 family type VII secretion target [Streptomyces mayteni]